MNAHPAAELFPMMSEAELAELAEDIHANGLLEDITLCQGQVLDGRNRLRACKLVGEPPRFHYFDGDDPVRFVISKNLTRRHLTIGQRALIGAKARPMLREQAEQRKRNGWQSWDKSDNNLPEQAPPASDQQKRSWPDRASGQSAKQAGDAVGVSDWSVKRAEWLLEDAPDLAAQVEAGELPLTTAVTQYEQRPAYQKRQRKPEGKGAEAKVPRKPGPGPKAAPPEIIAQRVATSLSVLVQELRRLPTNDLTPETWDVLRRQLDNVMAVRTALRKAREHSEVSHVA